MVAAGILLSTSGRKVDKFAKAKFRKAPSMIVKPPIIDGSTVAFECRVIKKVKTGDHTLYKLKRYELDVCAEEGLDTHEPI